MLRSKREKWEMTQTNNLQRKLEWLLVEKYNGIKTEGYFADVERIKKGEPVDYVIGFSKFFGTIINLDYKPLIPRVETEYWVEKAVKKIKEKFFDSEIRVLDIFSGSGCVGISVLKNIPSSFVDFVDVDESMAHQIKKNLEINNTPPNRYRIFVSDLFACVDVDTKYDVVFANPPYIDKGRNVTDQSVVLYEPHIALFADNYGMHIIENFVKELRSFLKTDFMVFIEHDDDQVERIESLLTSNGYKNYFFNKDQFGLSRWVEILP